MAGQTLRDLARQPGGGSPSGQRPVAPQAGDDIDEDPPEGYDSRKAFNENRKLSRLLSKSQQQLQGLSAEIEPLKGVKKQFDSFRNLFGAKEEAVAEGVAQPSIYDRARKLHERAIEQDPESPGMPLTVDIAQQAHEAFSLVKEQSDVIKKMQAKLEVYEKPMYHAEQVAFVSLANRLEDKVVELFEDQGVANDNYKAFEESAIGMINQMKSTAEGMRKWQRILHSPQQQDAFVQSVIQKRMPRAFVRRGAEPMEEYSASDAMADQERASKMPAGPQRAQLMKRARQRMLQEAFDAQVDMGGARR